MACVQFVVSGARGNVRPVIATDPSRAKRSRNICTETWFSKPRAVAVVSIVSIVGVQTICESQSTVRPLIVSTSARSCRRSLCRQGTR